MKHIDLFSGIGGFAIAAYWNGIQTEVMCENDKRCREFLQKTWPGVPIVDDIRNFDGTRWRGRFLLTGGVPCQPASRAGKQGGDEDDRWLWPEAIRIIGEALPRWCLLENPPGIYDVGIDGILSDLERIGYETGIVEIPACAVNAPHIRQRVWILANTTKERHEERGSTGGMVNSENGGKQRATSPASVKSDMADTKERQDDIRRNGDMEEKARGWEGGNASIGCLDESDVAHTKESTIRTGLCTEESGEIRGRRSCDEFIGLWSNHTWTSCADGKLRRTPDDSFGLVDGLHRSVLAALGNSIVPQVASEIINSILNTEGGDTKCESVDGLYNKGKLSY